MAEAPPEKAPLEFEVRSYRSTDDEKIVRLLQLVFEGWPGQDVQVDPVKFWRWKYENKFLKEKLIALAVKDDEIIGTLQSIPVLVKVKDRSIPGCLGGDACVHPDYRRLGVWNALSPPLKSWRQKAGIKFVYASTRNPIVIRKMSREREGFPFQVINLTRIKDIALQIRKIPVKHSEFVKLGFHVLNVYNGMRNIFNARDYGAIKSTASEIKTFSKLADSFWGAVKDHYDFIIERGSEHLNWRYIDLRAGKFLIRSIVEDEKLLGYCVLSVNRALPDYPAGYIVDMLTLPDRLDVADLLVSDAVRFFDDSGINIVNTLVVKDHPYTRVFSRHGFLDSRIRMHLFYTDVDMDDRLKKDVGELKSPERIHFSYGDLDALPIYRGESINIF